MTSEVLARYRLVRKLGAGGMGVVYEAEDRRLGRTVALKFLPEEIAHDEHALQRFRREAHAASSLNHPHICTIYDIDGDEQGRTFIVMEKLEGATLSEKLAGKPLPMEEVVELGIQIADALAAAHAKGIVHRDLKPGNVFVTTDGQAKLLDFGLAKLTPQIADGAITASVAESLTAAGDAVGTLMYMSPEQVLGKQVDARTDLFSFGVVLYEMVTGKRPFQGETVGALVEGIVHGMPMDPERLNANVPAELGGIITRALEKDRDMRYQSAAQFAIDLQHLKAGEGAKVSAQCAVYSSQRLWSRQRRALNIFAVLITAAVATVVAYKVQQPALSARDEILLADFINKTGDPAFDESLQQALAVKLAESPYLNVVSEERVRDALKMMEKPTNQRLTPEVAKEICQRLGVKATLGGQVSTIGEHYIIMLNAVNCRSGESVARQQIEAENKETVLRSLGEASSKLRRRLGESLQSIRKYDVPLEEATTSSLEALKAYSVGRELQRAGDDPGAVLAFEHAVQLDPNFAQAWRALDRLRNLGQAERGKQSLKKAFELRGRVSERERNVISATYYYAITGELEKAEAIHRLNLQTYPRDITSHVNQQAIYNRMGRFEEAVQHGKDALLVFPNYVITRGNLVISYLGLGRYEEAKSMADGTPGGGLRYLVAFVQGDEAAMKQATDIGIASTNPAFAVDMLFIEAQSKMYNGQRREAKKLLAKAAEIAKSHNLIDYPPAIQIVRGLG